MSYIEATDTSLRKTGQIKLHGQSGFAGMRKAGALVAKCLDELTDIVKAGVPTSEIDEFVRAFAFSPSRISACRLVNDQRSPSLPTSARNSSSRGMISSRIIFDTRSWIGLSRSVIPRFMSLISKSCLSAEAAQRERNDLLNDVVDVPVAFPGTL